MGFYKYDLKKPILPQLEEIRPQVEELAAFNKELGIGALYQNHSDAKYVGCHDLGFALALSKTSLSIKLAARLIFVTQRSKRALSWPVLYDVIKPHIGASVSLRTSTGMARRPSTCRLGTGRVDPKFFDQVKQDGFNRTNLAACRIPGQGRHAGQYRRTSQGPEGPAWVACLAERLTHLICI